MDKGVAMRGDRLIIDDRHRAAAARIAACVAPQLVHHTSPFVLTVGGESGSGKSEIAQALADALSERQIVPCILQQDDFFAYPPKTNDMRRRQDISRVGVYEVRMELLQQTIAHAREGRDSLVVPLVDYAADRIESQTVSLDGIAILIIEGTYTSLLQDVDLRVFLERTVDETRASRIKRGREAQDDFIEQVLQIEHAIIREHRPLADLLVTKDYRVVGAPTPAARPEPSTKRATT